MAMSTGGGDKKGVQSEINVTPLIDVLLVLLIIFLVVMPIMMKMETLEIPRKLEDNETVADQNAVMITITVNPGGSVTFDDTGKETQINFADLLTTLRPKLENWRSSSEKVVFINFHNDIEWGEVIATMDSVRSLATDVSHDEIKVALKIKEDPADAAAKQQ
jgi:biopolymer transport protein TolR